MLDNLLELSDVSDNLSWYAADWIIRNQFGRRNLTLFQRAELALKLKPMIAARAEQRMLSGTAPDPTQNSAGGETRDELAKLAGVSHDTIAKVEVIIEKAPEPVKEAVRRGESSITASV